MKPSNLVDIKNVYKNKLQDNSMGLGDYYEPDPFHYGPN